MLTNTQFQYIAYGVMIMVVFILVINVFITKVNNNYDNNTFETFGNIREGMENKKLSEDIKNINSFSEYICKNDKNTDEISKEIPKIINLYAIVASSSYFNFYNKYNGILDEKSEKSPEYKSFSNSIKLIEQLKTMKDGLDSFELDCNKSHLNISKFNFMKNKEDSNSDTKSDSKSWF